ncbi:hypothetical protein VNO77_10023 [Canavalia gladiata]|uniref:Uncharacterized protein n=1 Tax=Canavalia gladiata TaxID=3824 RepID=A0AAN9MGG4_CANGL
MFLTPGIYLKKHVTKPVSHKLFIWLSSILCGYLMRRKNERKENKGRDNEMKNVVVYLVAMAIPFLVREGWAQSLV